MNLNESNWFSAKYPGYCRACGAKFKIDDSIGYNEENEIVGNKCCGGEGKDELDPVMPTGKTKEDRCGDCFMVHSNGQKECE